MYDSKEIETYNNALLLIAEIKMALARGTKHFRVSDGKLLETLHEILDALKSEGEIQFKPRKEEQ